MSEWAALFDNYGIKTVSPTDKDKGAYVPTVAQRFAMVSAGLEPSYGEGKAVHTIGVLFDPALRSMQISYYNSERVGSGRAPEARIGQGLPRWVNVGDEIVIGNVGNRVFVAKEPIPPPGQDFLTAEDGSRLISEQGDYLTVESDLDQLTSDLEAGRPTLIGSPAELRARRDLLVRIRELEEEVDRLRPGHGGMGHNNPPPDFEQEAIPAIVLDTVSDATGIIRSELVSEEPDALEIARAGLSLRSIGNWLAGKGEVFADEFAKAFGKSLGSIAGKGIAAVGLIKLISLIIPGLTAWLQTITWPF